MTTWLLYSIGIGVLLAAAAAAGACVLLASGRSTRWIWLGAVGASGVLPFALPWLTGRETLAPDGAAGGEVLVGEIGLMASGGLGPGGSWMDGVLVGGWLVSSAVLVLLFAWSALALRLRRRGWSRRSVNGVPTLVSEGTGPALVGFVMPELVLPAWVLEWDAESLGLLLAHEEEHARARDPLLLLAGILAVVAMPWNLPLWWQSRRLRLAMEMDCDARVLRRHPDARRYGLLLLEVGRMASSGRVPMAAFSEPTSFLERRVALLTGRRRMRRSTAGVLIAAAITAVAVACAIPAPDAPAPDAILRPDPVDEAASPDPTRAAAADTIPVALRNPAFTPYEVRPELIDRAVTAGILQSVYPTALRDAGIEGTTVLWTFIDAAGAVRDTRVATPSGHPEIDAAAEAAMLQVRFTPAMNGGEPVPVWIQLPVTFMNRRAGAERGAPGTPAAPDHPVPAERAPVPTSPEARASTTSPPSPERRSAVSPTFTPYDVRPELRNRTEFSELLERTFLPILSDAGVSSGTAVYWVRIGENGEVQHVRLAESSGSDQLDAAGAEVLLHARFSPARNRGRAVSVWIQLPVTFQTRDPP